MDDMGTVMIKNFDEFISSEMDIHIGDSTADTQLYSEIKSLSQAAIQNGQAKIEDLIAISTSESVQETSRKLKASAERIRKEQEQMAAQDREANMQMQQMKNELQEKMWQRDDFHKNEDRKVKYAKINAKLEEAALREEVNLVRDNMRIDSDGNGIADEIDLRRTEVDENFKENSIRVQEEKLNETIRNNKANEEIKREKIAKTTKQEKK